MSETELDFDTWLVGLSMRDPGPDSAFGEDYVPSWNVAQGQQFIAHALRLLADLSVLAELRPKAAENIVWNLANWLSQIVDNERFHLERRLQVIRALAVLFEQWFVHLTDYSPACDIFWDAILNRNRDLCTAQSAAIFHALERQLQVPNRWCQLSALHGFGHLGDIGCRPIIDAFQQTCTDTDRGVYDYAAAAKQFEVL